ncbi:MAG TPA: hypothetical protein VFI45_18475, partial [Candidatus Acidoferrum sp.]|nr:hypothetical protein [Candidatus Acidoferrum sp.]
MTFSSSCHPDRSGRFSLPFAPRERRPRSGGTPATKPEFIWPSLSTSSLLRVLCALCALCVNLFSFPAKAQNFDKPVTNIDEEVTAFAYAPNGNVVFSVRRMFKTKKYDLQRDDIWLLESGGKRKRLLEGQKFTHDDKLFTYQVESFTWSPNAKII